VYVTLYDEVFKKKVACSKNIMLKKEKGQNRHPAPFNPYPMKKHLYHRMQEYGERLQVLLKKLLNKRKRGRIDIPPRLIQIS